MVKRIWTRLGSWLGRLPVAVVAVAAAGTLLVLQGMFLGRHMRLKVEASDLLPEDHPKNAEFDFIRDTFKGSSRGFFVAVEAPVVRLRQVVPAVARACEGLPEVDFIRWRIEREYFEDQFLLFQSLDHLEQQAAYLEEYRGDVKRLLSRGGSFADFLDGMADIIDGEQELGAATDEAAKDRKLAHDLESLAPFLETMRRALETLAAGEPLDPRFVDQGLEELLLRGWYDHDDVARLDRELQMPENIWDKPGSTMALVWVATRRSDVDPDFSSLFMRRAEAMRSSLAARFPDVGFRLTGGIASYDTYARTVRSDFAQAQAWSLAGVLLLLVLGFRALAPFALLMVLLTTGTLGTLVIQNLLFGGVNMIATAGALAIVGIGSDYGVVFLLAYQRELEATARERERTGRMLRKQWLRAVRLAISRALASIGSATTIGCFISAASFLALAGADVIPWIERLLGRSDSISQTFQPIRELGVGGALGLVYSLVLMLGVLPAGVFLVEWLKSHPLFDRAGRLARPIRRRLRRSKRWLRWRGRARLVLRTDHEKRWFRSLAMWALRNRLWIIAGGFVLFVAGGILALRVEWATGQREVEPRHSEPVAVQNRVEATFGKSFENLLVYGPLDVVRRFHARMDVLRHAPGTNVAEVTSIDDFLPPAGESQEAKLALARRIETALAGVRPVLPPGDLMVTAAEVGALAARLGDLDRRLAVFAGRGQPGAAAALTAARVELALVGRALAERAPLEPAADWAGELAVVDSLAEIGAECAAAGARWLEEGRPPARIAEVKLLGRALAGAPAVVVRHDLRAAALALGDLGLGELAARLHEMATSAPAPEAHPLYRVDRAALRARLLALEKFVADSTIWGLQLEDAAVFGEAVMELETALDGLALRTRPAEAERGSAIDRSAAATARLRRSLDSFRSFAAASGFASVAPRVPAAAAALDRLLAFHGSLPADRAEAVMRNFDAVFVARLFDRFQTVKRSAARAVRPIGVADVPESARRIFTGRAPDGSELYLARVLPRTTMLQRQPYQEMQHSVEAMLADAARPGVVAGYSGFEVLLNLATDYLETTFTGAMVAVCAFVLLVLYGYNRSLAATLVLMTPIALGAVLTVAFMVLVGWRISVFTVVAIPIVIGVAADSSIQVLREYWQQLAERGRAPLADVMGETGKMITLNSLSTVLPFGVMVFGEMKGLVALGAILALGIFLCLVAKLTLLPALISFMHDYVVPAAQYEHKLHPRRRVVRLARRLLGRWQTAVPFPDPGLDLTRAGDEGVLLGTGRRPPLNLLDAAMVTFAVETTRNFLDDPDLSALVFHSLLPRYYHVEDASGALVVDGRGRTRRIAAALAESDALPPGFKLIGPLRPLGGGADLRAMAANPLDAVFTLRGAVEEADLLWYARKPVIFVAEGDAVGGHFELGMCSNFLVVTPHARLGAPEVKRGLTLPFGAHALAYRAGNAVARRLMSSGELISGEEAVRLGIADALVPEGEDAMAFTMRLCRSQEFYDRVQQTAILRQYGPPMRSLVQKSIRNYVRMLRTPATRTRLKSYLKEENE